MKASPAIKGTAIRSLVQSTREALADGSIRGEVAAGILVPEDVELLDADLVDTGWYSIRSYERLSVLLRQTLGQGDDRYLHKRGAAVAERLIGLGVYQQVSFLQRIGASETLAIAHQNLKLTATMWNSFFNFGTWSTALNVPARQFSMHVVDSEPMPMVGWDAVEGFIWRLTQEVDGTSVTMKREHLGPGAVQFIFHLTTPSIRPRR
jgi:hypothetical protein